MIGINLILMNRIHNLEFPCFVRKSLGIFGIAVFNPYCREDAGWDVRIRISA